MAPISLTLAVIAVLLSSFAHGGRHLSVLIMSTPAAGHIAMPIALGQELARRGHNVTLFTAQLVGYDYPRLKAEGAGLGYAGPRVDVSYEALQQLEQETSVSSSNESSLSLGYRKVSVLIPALQEIMRATEVVLDSPSLKEYDIVIASEFAIPIAVCLTHNWAVPLVAFASVMDVLTQQTPSWPFPGYSGRSSDDLDFAGRLLSTIERQTMVTLLPLLAKLLLWKVSNCAVTMQDVVLAPGVTIPHLIPTAIGFEYPRPISPLTTYTGPYMSLATDPLPGDIQMWLDRHPTGSVVYISMGTVAFLTQEAARAIVEGLDATGYNAVWSLRKKNRAILDGLEVNDKKILLLDWAPQLAILRHRSIRMAILHGGMNGVQEALHSGVPIIVLPVFGDQPANAAKVAHHGFGIRMNYENLTSLKIAESIRKIEKGNYHANVAKLQKVFHHAGGVTKAADLVELYAEVGYDHLIPAYARYGWTWIQYYNVDVYGLLLVIGGIIFMLILRLYRCLCVRCYLCVKEKRKVD